MSRIAFIGLGNMGGGMAANLVKAGHEVHAFDLSSEALARAQENGCQTYTSVREAVQGAQAVVSMLPNGKDADGPTRGRALRSVRRCRKRRGRLFRDHQGAVTAR